MTEAAEGGDPILDALSSQVDGMVTGYALVATYIDADGDTCVWHDTLENQRCHETMGLLQYALAIEQRRAVKSWEAQE